MNNVAMRRRGSGNDIGAFFGKGRSWSERTTLQRLSLILDFVVVGVIVALVLGVLWLLITHWG